MRAIGQTRSGGISPVGESLIERGDFWRGPFSKGGAYREWAHFCVLTPQVHLLVNFSVSRRPGTDPQPRLVVLARTAEAGWDGDVEQIAPRRAAFPAGGIALDIGDSRLRYRRGAYELSVRLRDRPIEARLRLRPRARPALSSSVPLGKDPAMKWFVVPRLEAEGEIRVDGQRIRVARAPAYHDHDWGEFGWGGDFSWEWAIALPSGPSPPWTLIFQRISDRARTRTLSQGLLLWRGAQHHRTLHAGAVDVEPHGRLSAVGALRLPTIMSLASPGRAADLPARLDVRARGGEDTLEGSFELLDLAQVAVPNDADLGSTVISECSARARFEGRVGGRDVVIDGPALVELNRACA